MEKNYDFRKRMLQVHKSGIRDRSLIAEKDELVISDGACIIIPDSAGAVINRAAIDFQDYLMTSMGISAVIKKSADILHETHSGEGSIIFASKEHLDCDLMEGDSPRGYRIDCGRNIIITGYDEAGAMQGGFYIEDIMNIRHAPFVKKGTAAKHQLFSPRMTHSGFGLDMYPDQHLAAIAHAGMDTILVFVEGVNMTQNGYLDFNDVCRRAAEYGLDVYVYSLLKSKLHPDDPGAEEYYDKIYGSVFQSCPAFKGVVLVGESVEFPSKDKRTTGKSYLEPPEDGLPADKPSPGWFPCDDFPKWLSMIRDTVRKHRRDADIVFWTYNWGYVAEKERRELIDALPCDITLLVTFEMFQRQKVDSVTVSTVDYTLRFEGPGDYFLSEAKAAKERGLRLYTMANTGGLTWDIGVIPYEPMPQQWIRRHRAILDMADKYGLSGLMESHHYGFWPSFIGDLAKWNFTAGSLSPEDNMQKLAARDFGAQNAAKITEAWSLWSEGIRLYISTDEDQYGPFRIGPSYPLVLLRDVDIPAADYAVLGNRICGTLYGSMDMFRFSLRSFRLPVELKSLEKMEAKIKAGIDILEELAPEIKAAYKENMLEMINLGRFIMRCVKTVINVKKWYMLKLKLLSTTSESELLSIVSEMTAIARQEISNAEATIELVNNDSRLGWEPTMEYMCDEDHLRWKIKQVQTMLKNELEMYPTALKYNANKNEENNACRG